MKKTKEQKTGMHISLVGTPEELIRLKNIIVAARDKAEIFMMGKAFKEETHPDSQEEKKEEKPESINGKVFAKLRPSGETFAVFIADGEQYCCMTGYPLVNTNLYIHPFQDIMHPIKLNTKRTHFELNESRPATREEIDLLRKVLYEHDLVWDAKKQQLVKRETVEGWKPIDGQPCWICYYYTQDRGFIPMLFEDGEAYHEEIKRGWAFPTKHACQRMCDKLNAAILQTSINEQIGL